MHTYTHAYIHACTHIHTASRAHTRAYLLVVATAMGPHLVPHDPPSVVDETIAKAMEDLENFQGPPAAFPGWLRAHLIGVIARKVGRDPHEVEQWLFRVVGQPEVPSPPDPVSLERALRRLPEDQRTAVELKHLHGWRVRAIAAEMGRSQTAVAVLLRRGLKTLQNLMREP